MSPRQVSPTVLEKTSDRPKPTSRDARVSPATPAATEAKPALTRVVVEGLRVRRAPELIQLAQQRRALDHGGEAHPLADQVERRDRDKGEQPEPPRQGLGGSSTDRGTERVGAAVTEHGSGCQIGRQAARRSADCRRCAEADQARAEQDDRFRRSAGRRSSRLVRLAVAAMSPVSPSSARHTGFGQPGRERWKAAAAAALRPTPRTLIVPLVTSPERSARRWPRKPLAWVTPKVVVGTHHPRSDTGDGHRQASRPELSSNRSTPAPASSARPPRSGPLRA